MEMRPILALLGLLASASLLAQAYTWVDKDGVTHYSDRPQEGAEQVDLAGYSRNTGTQIYRPTKPQKMQGHSSIKAWPLRPQARKKPCGT